jgi:hypothetical protein
MKPVSHIRSATLAALALGLVGLGAARAQVQTGTYPDHAVFIYTQAPYPFTPLTPGQHALAITSATGLTVPTGATRAQVCATTAVVKFTTDGTTTPTSSVGQPLQPATCINIDGPLPLANFKAISATGTLDVEYFK